MTKHQKIDVLPNIDRRSFLVGTAATGLVFGYVALPEIKNALAAPAANFEPSIWYAIGHDGKVTVTVGKADMGQHIASTMAQLVAEELEASWKDMAITLASNDPKYNDPILGAAVTGGSWSTGMNFDAMCRAGAAGRITLIKAAAEMLGVPESELYARDSHVHHAKSKRSLTYAQIVSSGKASQVWTADDLKAIKLKTPDQYTKIGQSLPQLDIPAKTNGTAKYGIDAFVPDMLYGKLALPPVRFGATVKSVDDSDAKKVPGFVKAVTVEDKTATTSGWVVARSVLEGSIRRAANRVRITAQLIDAATGAHLWADRYDRDLTDIFEVQDEVVEKIVGALAVTLTRGEQQRLRRHGTNNVEAYECWLRARALLTRGSRASIVQARAMYRRAIEFDLNFAAPHAGLALAAIADYVSGWALDSAQALLEAERWARRALELNDQEPVSHMALGNVLLWRRDHEGALAEFGRTIALDPNFAQGHAATGLALMYAGEPARALEPFAIAMRLDPHYPDIVLHFLAQANFSLGKYEIAAQQLIDRIARNPSTDASRMLLASCYGHLGRVEDARAVWTELLKVNPDFSLTQRSRVLPYKNADDFQRILEGLAKAGLP